MMEDEDGVLSKKQTGSQSTEDDSGGSASGAAALKKGPWTAAEDAILVEYVKMHGEGNWNAIQKHSGLSRCGKSCRLRWANHLRPNLKKGAFTQEEEQLIIELHAKMGNKWARMAAHLPGRTDNEIKNYWNTRIKRRQRAGLPVYPPELSLQTFQESPLGLDVCGSNADKGHHDLLRANSYEIPDFACDSSRANQGLLAYDPELFDITARSLTPYDGFMSPAMHGHKRLRESANLLHGFSGSAKNEFSFLDQFQDDPGDNIPQSFGLDFPFDPDLSMKNLPTLGENQDSPTLSDCDFSASKPASCAVKLELPSLQYPESLLGSSETSSIKSFGTLMQSPHAEIVESDCPSPRNSGLLDALLHEAKALCNAKNNSSDKSSNSSTVDIAQISSRNICETECEDYGDALSPLGHTATSLVSDCMPISASGSLLNEQLLSSVTFNGCNVKLEPVDQTWATYGTTEGPDALLVSDWLEGGKDQVIMTDAIASLLGNDLSNEYEQMASGASTSSRGLGIGFFAWNNMPPVCQMSELP